MEKPTVFNYQEHVKALERIEELEAKVEKLESDIEYWQEYANQQRIRLRILEGDKKNEGEIYRIGRSR